jgi:hypothetical protein
LMKNPLHHLERFFFPIFLSIPILSSLYFPVPPSIFFISLLISLFQSLGVMQGTLLRELPTLVNQFMMKRNFIHL